MTDRETGQAVAIQFYATAPYACSYLAGKRARSQVAVPTEAINSEVYSQLVRQGFRRSGFYIYRPYCDACQACLPLRIPVAAFRANRTQRKVMRRLSAMEISVQPLHFNAEHYALYCSYQRARHAEGGVAEDDQQQYAEFILKSKVDSRLVEFRLAGELKMLSLIDCLADGISAVYTFYDPQDQRSSLGVFNVLWQIELARQCDLPYLYLGYWIAECRKMSYKASYQPLQILQGGSWVDFTATA
ncbi:arginyltransferase [Neisseriaceae bacterium TC5R-5]|nr:arginyltransferase [Neisseriaceae bacterium TC5R-5]